MRRKLLGLIKPLSLLVVLLCANGGALYATDTTDPFFAQCRARMQQVRTTLGRPTVGLVLSGGGAMGASEVGVIKYLEELGIPIDLVCGTSIGGLLGALYAIGYESEDLREIFTSQDWNKILSDNVDARDMSYLLEEYNSKTLYSIKLGKRQRVSESYALPAGLIDGFNVNNLFSSLTVGYEGNVSFSELPIPYACVAADLISCKAYNWVDGSLATAMRSTMSIPGLFSPVKARNMVLVDGGVRNNFPSDLAKAMGADYIIGVDLHNIRAKYEDVNHLGNVVKQLIAMFGRDTYDDNLALAQVVVKPNLEGFNMLSFSSKAVDNLVDIGYRAAKEVESELLELKRVLGNSRSSRRGEKAINIAHTPVAIQSVRFTGLDSKETQMMLKMIDLDTSETIDRNKMENIMGKLQASGYFSEIRYTLEGSAPPYDLVFTCEESPTNRFGFGLRGDTEEGVAVYLNYGINANRVLGSKLEFDAKVNHNLNAKLKYSYVSHVFPVINLETSFSNINMRFGSPGSAGKFNMHYRSLHTAFYLSLEKWNNFLLRGGLQNYWIRFLEADLMSFFMDDLQTEDYVGVFADAHYHSLNDPYFPTRGTNFDVEGRYDFANLFYETGFAPVWRVALQFKTVLPVGQKLAFIPSVNAVGGAFTEGNGEDEDIYIPLSSLNYLGGVIDKRYHRNHVAFFGITNVALVDDYLLTGTLEMRCNFANKWYGSLLGGYYRGSSRIKSFFERNNERNNSLYAFGAELNYKTKIGPIKCNVHWNSSHTWGGYLSVGYNF